MKSAKSTTKPGITNRQTVGNTQLSLRSKPGVNANDLQSIAIDHTISGKARDFIRDSLSKATQRAYKGDLRHFRACGGSIPASPLMVAQYLADLAGQLSVATLRRRLASIAKAHTVGGYPNPVDSESVRLTLRGIRKTHGKPQRQARPLACGDLLRMFGELQGTQGIRDQVLLLVGFAGAFRRSELVALDVEDLEFSDDGLLINLRRSKTDQEGVGRQIPIPFARGNICPVRSLRRWLEVSAITTGPIFRGVTRSGRILANRLSAQSVALILRKRVAQLGLSTDRISGHSLRSGFVTSAAKVGASIAKISVQTGHRSTAMVMRYMRDADLFADHPLSRLL